MMAGIDFHVLYGLKPGLIWESESLNSWGFRRNSYHDLLLFKILEIVQMALFRKPQNLIGQVIDDGDEAAGTDEVSDLKHALFDRLIAI